MPGRSEGLPPEFNFRQVVPGRLYRSAEPAMLTPQDWSKLVADTGLTTVIDLRMSAERAERGVTPPMEGVTVWSLPLFEEAFPDWANPQDGRPQAIAQRYLEMLEMGAPVVQRIAEMLESNVAGPTLVHCAAGRDRTGLVVGCLLSLWGWSDQAIAEDYAFSDGRTSGGRAKPETMGEFLDLVRRRHGSVPQLLRR